MSIAEAEVAAAARSMMRRRVTSIVEDQGVYTSSCGYCKSSSRTSVAQGMHLSSCSVLVNLFYSVLSFVSLSLHVGCYAFLIMTDFTTLCRIVGAYTHCGRLPRFASIHLPASFEVSTLCCV